MKLVAGPSTIVGTGCFAVVGFKKGDIVGEYTGERIGDEEADSRYEGQEMTYLFYVNDGEYIDALHDSNPVKYINHSCDPNCESEQDDDRIFIRALRDITAGEELTYDYRYIVDENDEDEYTCVCGTKNCRKTMRAP